MSLCRWRGNGAGTKSNWADGRNWVDENGVAYAVGRFPGSIPGTYDDVWFDEALAVGAMSVAGGDYHLNEKLRSLSVGPAYDGGIGSAAQALFIWHKYSLGEQIIINGKAAKDIYIGLVGDLNIYEGLHNIIILDGSVIFSGDGRIHGLKCLKGNITISTGLEIWNNFHVGFIVSQNDVNLTIESGVTIMGYIIGPEPYVTITGGYVVCNSPIQHIFQMSGGHWIQNGNISRCIMLDGTLIWNSGTLSARIFGGLVDGSQSQEARELNNVIVYEKGVLNLNNGVGNIEITNGLTIIKGKVKFPHGQQLQPYP